VDNNALFDLIYWYPHDHKHFAINCYVSALYGDFKGLWFRRILRNEHIEVTLVSVTLSTRACLKKISDKKFYDAAFFARDLVVDCLQVCIAKNLTLHATPYNH